MKIPETVQVGPRIFAVRIDAEPFISEDNTMVLEGQCNFTQQEIRIWNRHPDSMYVTFWHEVLHAIDVTACTELSEDQVNRLAPILASVLLDNGIVERDKVVSRKP